MKAISYVASLLCLYLMAQGWSFLWDIHFMLPVGILVAMLFLGMLWIMTAENRRKARSDRIFEKMCNELDS